MEDTTTQAQEVVNALTVKAVASAVGVSESAIRVMLSDRRRRGLLPSSWYFPLKKVAKSKRAKLPLSAFKWKNPTAKDTAA